MPAQPAHLAQRPRLVNPRADRVRAVRRLAGRAGREKAGQFLAEGPQSVREAIRVHARSATPGPVVAVYSTDEAASRYPAELAAAQAAGIDVVGVDDRVLAAMTDTVTPQGLVAVCRLVDRPWAQVLDEVLVGDAAQQRPVLVAVLSHVRDPGNAGTVLRAADAAGAAAVVLTTGSVDIHNPKCVRATAGSLFHLPVVQDVELDDLVADLTRHGVTVLAADGAGDRDLDDLLDEAERDPKALLRRPTAWVFGNEAWGLQEQEQALADAVVRVPLHGQAESLNLATAATVCLYASARAHRPRRGDVPAPGAHAGPAMTSRYSPVMGIRVGDGWGRVGAGAHDADGGEHHGVVEAEPGDGHGAR